MNKEIACFKCEGQVLIPFRTMKEGPYCSKECYYRFYPEHLPNKASEENKDINSLYREIIINLVTLAIKTNDVVIQGTFSGAISDEVNGLLTLCNEIKEQYVEESK